MLGAVNDLTRALENYGGVVIQAGYNHAVAEHNATPGNQGPAPAMPPQPASTAGVLSAPPSAGGPGRGLVDAIGLMQQVGVPVPDGDTDKVSAAADAWDRLATVYQTKTIAEGLEVDARTFRDTHSPEVEYIVRDLGELRGAMTAVTDGCAELSQSCRDYKSALDDLRTQLEGILKDLAIELAVTAAIGIAASFVSFGAGAVAGTAKAAQSITKFARIISEAVGAWKISKNIASGVKKVRDIAGLRAKLQRIINMARKGKPPTSQRKDSRYCTEVDQRLHQTRRGANRGRDGGIRVRETHYRMPSIIPSATWSASSDVMVESSYRHTGENATVVVNERATSSPGGPTTLRGRQEDPVESFSFPFPQHRSRGRPQRDPGSSQPNSSRADPASQLRIMLGCKGNHVRPQ